jgi:hypothetical protein
MALKLTLGTLYIGDILRLVRELEALDGYMIAQHQKEAHPQLPKLSRSLENLAAENSVLLQNDQARANLYDALQHVKTQAPIVRMSLASDPSASFVQRIVGWFRAEVHPLTLIQIGVQPSIAAGCVLSAGSHRYDFSLREQLSEESDALLNFIRAASAESDVLIAPKPLGAPHGN